MWLINKRFNFLSELLEVSKYCTALSTITQKGYEAVFMPIYDYYELAVKDFPHETIIEIK